MRWLCVGVAVLALACGSAARADDAEDAAAKWVAGVGGKLTRDDAAPGKPVVEVNLGVNKKVTDDGLKELKGFRNLKSLSLFFNGNITDAGMKHVKELTTLESLVLNSTGVTDAGIAELKGLVKLKSLSATGCVGMTDKSAETIAGFTELTDLALPLKFTDKGVKQLAGLKKMKSLYLGGCTALTDAAMKDIGDNMPDLDYLEVGSVDGNKITNASVLHLSQLKKLKKLGLSGSKMTADGLKALRDALPGCAITNK